MASQEKKKSKNVENRALSKVGADERQSWASIAFIWIGTMICIPMLMVGGILSADMTVGGILLAALLGFGMCSFIMVLFGMQAMDLGLPSGMCATKAFGTQGSSYLMSIVVCVAEIGWFSIHTYTCANAFNTLLAHWGISFPFVISCLLWGFIMLITAVYGFKLMKILNYLAVPFLVIVCCYGMFRAAGNVGWAHLMAYEPETSRSMSSAVSMVVGLFALGTVISADYSRYARSRTDTAKATVLGVLPAAILMLFVGAIMALSAGNSDITAVFASMGMPVISMLVLILATWTTNTGNAYSAGLAAMKIFNFKDNKRPMVTMCCGLLGTVAALFGLATVLEGFISILSSLVPPISGVMIADYWIIGRGKASNWHPVKGFNWIGIISWFLGCIVSMFFSFFSPALDGIIVCCIAYVVLHKAFGKTALAGQGAITIEEAQSSLR